MSSTSSIFSTGRVTAALIGLSAIVVTGAARAEDSAHVLRLHPAVLQQQQARGIDPNTFIVPHPAGLTWNAGHANHDHPAVVLARQIRSGLPTSVDASTFIVQPPASTRWTAGPAPEEALALLAR